MVAKDYHSFVMVIATGAGWLAGGAYLKRYFRKNKGYNGADTGLHDLFPKKYYCSGVLCLVLGAFMLTLFTVLVSIEPSGLYLSRAGSWITPVVLFLTWVTWAKWITANVYIKKWVDQTVEDSKNKDWNPYMPTQSTSAKLIDAKGYSSTWVLLLTCTMFYLPISVLDPENVVTPAFVSALTFACYILFLLKIIRLWQKNDSDKNISKIRAALEIQDIEDEKRLREKDKGAGRDEHKPFI
jgi:hypothetical protein